MSTMDENNYKRVIEGLDSSKVNWPDTLEFCPCGKPSGPVFRYGLCDEHADGASPQVFLRMGAMFAEVMLLKNRLDMVMKTNQSLEQALSQMTAKEKKS